ncbi:MAG: glycosyltransferase family 2 protein [Planctomycetota bacterium]
MMNLEEKRRGLTSYIIITSVRNEAPLIEMTIKSVIKQTVLPMKWIIVSDGSTDGTDDIVTKYARERKWIELLRLPERSGWHFTDKVNAFNAGYEKVKNLNYEIIGNIDADLTFEKGYMEFLLSKFAENANLGVAGTRLKEESRQYDYRFTNIEHVSGACALFRRKCFEDIGGYIPLKVEGTALMAVITARLKGWQTRTFPEICCVHYPETRVGRQATSKTKFESGYHDYLMGSHAVWQGVRSIYQMRQKPFVVGGVALLSGYLWAMMTQAERPVTKDLIKFYQMEQMSRLRGYLANFFTPLRRKSIFRNVLKDDSSKNMEKS